MSIFSKDLIKNEKDIDEIRYAESMKKVQDVLRGVIGGFGGDGYIKEHSSISDDYITDADDYHDMIKKFSKEYKFDNIYVID